MTRHRATEEGFALIEALVGMALAVFALFATLSLLDTGNRATTRSLAQEGGVTLARDVIERAHELPYNSLGATTASNALRDSFSDEAVTSVGPNTWTMTRRGIEYTVIATGCKIDDKSDGYGVESEQFCAIDSEADPDTGSSGVPFPYALSGNIRIAGLLIPLQAGGTFLDAICAALGSGALAGLIAPGPGLPGFIARTADVNLCEGQPAVVVDQDADDMARVTTKVSWTWGSKTSSVSQSTLVLNPGAPNP